MLAGDALLQQTMLQELQQPNARDLKFLQHWMKRPSMGSVYLLGLDSDIWEKPDLPDLISLGPGRSESIVSAWLTNSFVHQYHQILGRYLRVRHASRMDVYILTENNRNLARLII